MAPTLVTIEAHFFCRRRQRAPADAADNRNWDEIESLIFDY
jgi:hypothetical protein